MTLCYCEHKSMILCLLTVENSWNSWNSWKLSSCWSLSSNYFEVHTCSPKPSEVTASALKTISVVSRSWVSLSRNRSSIPSAFAHVYNKDNFRHSHSHPTSVQNTKTRVLLGSPHMRKEKPVQEGEHQCEGFLVGLGGPELLPDSLLWGHTCQTGPGEGKAKKQPQASQREGCTWTISSLPLSLMQTHISVH